MADMQFPPGADNSEQSGATNASVAQHDATLEAIKLFIANIKANINNKKFIADLLTAENTKDKINHVLMVALLMGELAVANALLEAGVDVKSIGDDIIKKISDEQMFALILDYALQDNTNFLNSIAKTIIEIHNRPGQQKNFPSLFQHATANCKSNLLIWAVNVSHKQVVNFLISQADINKQDKDGNTPLMLAIQQNNLNFFSMFLDHHADANTQNKMGLNALMLAVMLKEHTIIAALMNSPEKLNLNMKNASGNTALMLASMQADYNTIVLLVKNHAAVNEQNNDGDTALMLAIKS